MTVINYNIMIAEYAFIIINVHLIPIFKRPLNSFNEEQIRLNNSKALYNHGYQPVTRYLRVLAVLLVLKLNHHE